MDTAKPAPPRSRGRLLLAIPVLLLLAVAVNWGNVKAVATGQRSLRAVIYGRGPDTGPSVAGWRMPKDTGEAGAKVVVEMFLIAGDPCHIGTALVGRALGTLDPARLRVKFVGSKPGSSEARRADEVKLGCDQGFAVNGKTKFAFPDPAKPGKKMQVLTSHKGGGAGNNNLYLILDQELKAAYKGKGLGMTAAEFDTRMQAETKRFLAIEEAMAAARAAGVKTKQP